MTVEVFPGDSRLSNALLEKIVKEDKIEAYDDDLDLSTDSRSRIKSNQSKVYGE